MVATVKDDVIGGTISAAALPIQVILIVIYN